MTTETLVGEMIERVNQYDKKKKWILEHSL